MMPKVLKESFDQLYEVADSQSGYFTARQALETGYSDRMQTYHVQAGDWIREWRGIYRLRHYPNPRPDDLMVWYLWSCNREGKPQGVFSHDTALELLELSTWTGSRIHMTVPKDFRRSKIPPALQLHYADLRSFETTFIRQVPITKPIRTMLDLSSEKKIQHHHLIESMQDARKHGLIAPNDLNADWLTDAEKRTLRILDSDAAQYKAEA
jgi:predicted transcriptional regulator of viral defense system